MGMIDVELIMKNSKIMDGKSMSGTLLVLISLLLAFISGISEELRVANCFTAASRSVC